MTKLPVSAERKAWVEGTVAPFLRDMRDYLTAPPHEIDVAFGQADYWVRPEDEGSVFSPEAGILGMMCRPLNVWLNKDDGKEYPTGMFYSLWFSGECMKIGVFFESYEFGQAFVTDDSSQSTPEMSRFFEPKARLPVILVRGDKFAVEWVFDLTGRDVGKEAALREFFVHGLRHVHFRLLDMVDLFTEGRRKSQQPRPPRALDAERE